MALPLILSPDQVLLIVELPEIIFPPNNCQPR